MKTYTKTELDQILAKHKLWLEGDKDGVKSDLSYSNLRDSNLRDSNLSGSNLRGSDLSGAKLNNAIFSENKLVKFFSYNKHIANYYDGKLSIGCLTHDLDHWVKNYEQIGKYNQFTEQEIKVYGWFIKDLLRRSF